MTQTLPFKQVDVFTLVPFKGNPLAVIYDADSLTDDQMKSIALWTNLSETIFLLKPTPGTKADYRVRIWTPVGELSFAGHPTIGACHSFRQRNNITGQTQFVQECGVGLVKLDLNENEEYFFSLPKQEFVPLSTDFDEFYESLGVSKESVVREPILFNVGSKWLVLEFKSADQVLQIDYDYSKLLSFSRKLGIDGTCCFGKKGDLEFEFETRTFGPAVGLLEDPVCGSGAGAVGLSLLQRGVENDVKLSQGQKLSRDGKIQVKLDKQSGTVKVGGQAVTVIDGTITV